MLITGAIVVGVATAIAVIFNRTFPSDYGWFMRLRRPVWLTFESAIPVIWIAIFICGMVSAAMAWQQAPGTLRTWGVMAGYVLVELAILVYMPAMCNLRSLRVGAMLGATGWFLGCLLAIAVWPLSATAGCLLLPYLVWSPIGTYVTWAMLELNPDEV